MALRFKILFVIGILLASTLTAWYLFPRSVAHSEDFEKDFGGWDKDAQVPKDPNNPGYPVAWEVTRVTTVSHSGQFSTQFYIDGRQDDGTVWIEKRITVQNNSQVHAEVSFEFYSQQESFNVIAAICAYVGTSNPEDEGDFVVLGHANEVEGWKRYNYNATLQTDHPEIWIAIGITVRWETEMTYNIDDVKVTIA